MNDDSHFELPAPEVFGPQGEHVVALLERARHPALDEVRADEVRALTPVQVAARDAARDAAWYAAMTGALGAARDAAREAAWDAARYAVKIAAWDAVSALVVRDLITTDHYDTLTRAWREAIGPIHPEDELWDAVAKAAK